MVVVSLKIVAVRALTRLGRGDHAEQRAGTILLHLNRRVEHIERALREQSIHDHAEDLRVHVVDLGFDDDDRVTRRRRIGLAHQHPENVWGVGEVAVACSVPNLRQSASAAPARTPARTPVTSSAPVGVTISTFWGPT